MNTDDLLALAEKIEASGDLRQDDQGLFHGYDQSCWHHACGAPACLSGHLIDMMDGWNLVRDADGMTRVRTPDGHDVKVDVAVARILEVPRKCAVKLICPEPEPFTHEDDPGPSSAEAAAMLRHLVETGEVDWMAGIEETS